MVTRLFLGDIDICLGFGVGSGLHYLDVSSSHVTLLDTNQIR